MTEAYMMTHHQLDAMRDVMREHDAYSAMVTYDTPAVLRYTLWRADEQDAVAAGTISIAGTVRPDVLVIA